MKPKIPPNTRCERKKSAYPVPYNGYGIHGISMEFPWNPRKFHGFYMDSVEFLWIPLKFK
jgi:hypothetical protein